MFSVCLLTYCFLILFNRHPSLHLFDVASRHENREHLWMIEAGCLDVTQPTT